MDNDFYIDITTMDSTTISTINISDLTYNTIDISTLDLTNDTQIPDDWYTITTHTPVEFEDTMPTVAKIEDMCNDYPALAQAYDKFKTIYAMVHQDWKGRQDAENEPPF